MSAPQKPWLTSDPPVGPGTAWVPSTGEPVVMVWEVTTTVISSIETLPQVAPLRYVRRTWKVPEAKSEAAQVVWFESQAVGSLMLPSGYQASLVVGVATAGELPQVLPEFHETSARTWHEAAATASLASRLTCTPSITAPLAKEPKANPFQASWFRFVLAVAYALSEAYARFGVVHALPLVLSVVLALGTAPLVGTATLAPLGLM